MPQQAPFGLTVHDSNHREVRRLKRQYRSQLHGNKLWGAAWVLIDYLAENPPPPGSRIIEAGCGWGLPGIYCAREFDAQVTAVDADAQVFPFLQLHAASNGTTITTLQSDFESLGAAQLQDCNWLIAADICFWDELVEPVYSLIARACDAGVDKIVIADPQRPTFFEMAEHCVEAFYGEIVLRRIQQPRSLEGALLVIENR